MRRQRFHRAGRGFGLLLLAGAGFGQVTAAAGEEFSAHRALEHVRVLSERIGPRKTGTEGERRAIAYLVERFGELGLAVDTPPVPAVTLRPGLEVIADTVNVVAELPGERSGAVLIGAHFDSRNRQVPGAIDDASGAAVVLEVARVLAAGPPAHTVRFVLFGAEEDGCIGSEHYAAGSGADDLRLVMTLDPVGRGRIFIAPFPDPPALGWMRALHRLGRRHGFGDRVLTDPVYALAPRFLPVPHLADHAPFLDRGIPAFNLSSEFDLWEYHTRLDRSDRIEPATLAAAGRALLAFLEEFETGRLEPAEDPHFLLLRLPGLRWFLTAGWMRAAGIAALVLGGAAGLWMRRRGAAADRLEIPRCAAAVLLVVVVSLSGPFAAELLAERWSGWRFPWYARQEISLAVAATLAGGTTWIALRLFRRIQPAVEPRPYLAAAGLLLWGEIALFLLLGLPEISFLFVPPLAALVAGAGSRRAGIRLLLLGAGFLHLPGLVAPATYRAALRFAGLELPAPIAFGALVVLALPPALALIGLSYHPDLMGKRLWHGLTHPYLLIAFAVGFVASGAAWWQRPGYDPLHRRTVRVRQTIDLDRNESRVTIDSQENLRRLRIEGPFRESIDLRSRRWSRTAGAAPALLDWSAMPVEDPEAGRAVRVGVALRRPAHSLRVRFRSPGGFLVPVPAGAGEEADRWADAGELEWRYVYEIERLEETYRLWPKAPESVLTVEVEARYEADLLGWRVEGEDAVVYHRNRARGSLLLPAPVARSGAGAAAGGEPAR